MKRPPEKHYWLDMTPEEIREYWKRAERRWLTFLFLVTLLLMMAILVLRWLGVEGYAGLCFIIYAFALWWKIYLSE